MKTIVQVPKEFSYKFCLQFLQRSPNEVLHRVEDGKVYKLLRCEDKDVLIRLTEANDGIQVDFLNLKPSEGIKKFVGAYVSDWFDLHTDLKPFYKLAKSDDLLRSLVRKYYGYRIVGQPDLFESLIWAVLGQQINVQFAHTLKRRFVEKYGHCLQHRNQDYFLFPLPKRIAELSIDQLLPLQFSSQKARYVIGIAEAFASGVLSRDKIAEMSFEDAKGELIKIKGIGNWTANYALMKTFRHAQAFPLEDVGLHNAIKNQLGLKSKPSLDRVGRIFKKYRGWEAYATLYLWKSL